ncbi:MAG: helix-turn-helix domain-containing protein [Hyphomicrobiales bacterium]|nr:helix-turn-helix domain-containing protein [Hyphomicrobiales bacterium]
MDKNRHLMDESNMDFDQSVLNCNLFGETGDLPDVVHCETIAARSVVNEWEFAPHRHARLHQILIVESGGGRASLDGATVRLAPMRAVNIPRAHVHSFSFAPGTQGWVVTLASEILDEMLVAAEGLRRVLAQAAILDATADMRALTQRIFSEFAGRDFARAHILRALSAALVGLVARELAGRADSGAAQDSSALARFEQLLEAHFTEHWSVARYAAALSITPTHLTRLARAATGRPASQLILERVMREARRNLLYTNLPVATVGYGLGYHDPAHFSRVFAGAAGLSPRAFRARNGEAGAA